MSALDSINNIVNNDLLSSYDFEYCLVNKSKVPYTIEGTMAKPNEQKSFSSLDEIINCKSLEQYAGVGVSIKFSKVCAIDVDGCFKTPFDVNSADDRAKDIMRLFKDLAYVEFSFSGTGLRILFHNFATIEDYETKYFTKNSKTRCEFYFPAGSARYVTITGKSIFSNPIKCVKDEDEFDLMNALAIFLDKYMKRPVMSAVANVVSTTDLNDDRSVETLMKKVKFLYLTDISFQNAWWSKAPGSGSNESELDCVILSKLFDNVTKDKEKIRLLFEQSKLYKTKDYKHRHKWEYDNHRYYNNIYNKLINGTLFRIKEEQ